MQLPANTPLTLDLNGKRSDRIIAISACPQEFNNAAGWYPTEILVDIFAEAADARV